MQTGNNLDNIKIGNVEYRETTTLNGKPYEEIVLWKKNPQYGAEGQMKKDGWVFDKNGNAHKGICEYDASCFKDPEYCYTVAMIEWNDSRDWFDVRSIGTRAFELNKEDYRSFKIILKLISKYGYNED